MAPPRSSFFKAWYAVEAIPIYVLMAGALGGASWYLYRLSMGPTTQWTRANPTPWNNVKHNETTKLMDPTGNFERWSRDKL